MSNQDIRTKAKKAKVALWQIADEMEICDMTLSRRLRRELPQSEKDEIFAIINRLKMKKESA